MYQVIEDSIKTKDQVVEYFFNAICGIRESILTLAKEYVMYLKNMPELRDKLIEMGHSRSTMNMLEKVGNGVVYEGYFFESGLQYKAIERLPLSEQERYAKQPIPVLTMDGTCLNISIANLTPDQTRQVFADDHIRNVAEQRAYIESLKTKIVTHTMLRYAETPKYIIKNSQVVTRSGDILTLEDLLECIAKIKRV